MKGLAGNFVAPSEASDSLAQRFFLSRKALEGTALSGEIGKILLHERGHRRIALGGLDTREPIHIIVHRNCDIFHVLTVSTGAGEVKPALISMSATL
jgi:hypothetical protein